MNATEALRSEPALQIDYQLNAVPFVVLFVREGNSPKEFQEHWRPSLVCPSSANNCLCDPGQSG